MEDLKERYYCICGKLTKVRAASGTEPKIYIFDAGHERRRKEQLDKLFNRTPEQVCNFGFLSCFLDSHGFDIAQPFFVMQFMPLVKKTQSNNIAEPCKMFPTL